MRTYAGIYVFDRLATSQVTAGSTPVTLTTNTYNPYQRIGAGELLIYQHGKALSDHLRLRQHTGEFHLWVRYDGPAGIAVTDRSGTSFKCYSNGNYFGYGMTGR
jgi:hypothetical protein